MHLGKLNTSVEIGSVTFVNYLHIRQCPHESVESGGDFIFPSISYLGTNLRAGREQIIQPSISCCLAKQGQYLILEYDTSQRDTY